MVKFRAKDFIDYNNKYSYNQYRYLYNMMSELFKLTGFDENRYYNDYCFIYDGMLICIDKDFGSYCEILGTGWLPMIDRIKLHETKLKEYRQKKVQLKLFRGF